MLRLLLRIFLTQGRRAYFLINVNGVFGVKIARDSAENGSDFLATETPEVCSLRKRLLLGGGKP